MNLGKIKSAWHHLIRAIHWARLACALVKTLNHAVQVSNSPQSIKDHSAALLIATNALCDELKAYKLSV